MLATKPAVESKTVECGDERESLKIRTSAPCVAGWGYVTVAEERVLVKRLAMLVGPGAAGGSGTLESVLQQNGPPAASAKDVPTADKSHLKQ